MEASLVRCFAVCKTLSKTSEGNVFFFKKIASLSKKFANFTRNFRLHKVHPETEIDKHDKLSVENETKETSQLEMCLFVFIHLSLG